MITIYIIKINGMIYMTLQPLSLLQRARKGQSLSTSFSCLLNSKQQGPASKYKCRHSMHHDNARTDCVMSIARTQTLLTVCMLSACSAYVAS